MDKIENAKIKDFFIGFEHRGCFTMCIALEGDGWKQTFGDYSLGILATWLEDPNIAMWFIGSILKTVGVYSVDELVDAPVRIERKEGLIVAIGNYLEDRWFNPPEGIKKMHHIESVKTQKDEGVPQRTEQEQLPVRRSREEYEAEMRRYAAEDPDSMAAKIVKQWDKNNNK